MSLYYPTTQHGERTYRIHSPPIPQRILLFQLKKVFTKQALMLYNSGEMLYVSANNAATSIMECEPLYKKGGRTFRGAESSFLARYAVKNAFFYLLQTEVDQ